MHRLKYTGTAITQHVTKHTPSNRNGTTGKRVCSRSPNNGLQHVSNRQGTYIAKTPCSNKQVPFLTNTCQHVLEKTFELLNNFLDITKSQILS